MDVPSQPGGKPQEESGRGNTIEDGHQRWGFSALLKMLGPVTWDLGQYFQPEMWFSPTWYF